MDIGLDLKPGWSFETLDERRPSLRHFLNHDFPDNKLIVVDFANLTSDPHKIATAVANEILSTDTGVDEVDE